MPTASVLHYATTCFEGMKLYRGHDGLLRLFRPRLNCKRMLDSSTRISLPAFDPEELLKLIKKLVSVDGEKWLPKNRPGTFLYLRPTMVGSGESLGVQVPKEAMLFIIALCFPSFDEPASISPPPQLTATAGRAETTRPSRPGMRLLASAESTIRAWPGGFGYAKVGANYGPSLIAQAEAKERGYNQILWLFGPGNEVTEAGATNFVVVWRTRGEEKCEMVTAPLEDKVILAGVTRRSVLELTRARLGDEVEVVERKFTIGEMEEAAEEGRLVEAFVCGTAVCSTVPSSMIRSQSLRYLVVLHHARFGDPFQGQGP